MQIREMTAEDIFVVDAIERRCFSVPWSTESFYDALSVPGQIFIVAEENGEIVGYAGMWCVVDEGQILNIAVDTPYRRKGCGAKLLKELMAIGVDLGMTFFSLEVRESNTAARSLYELFGFEVVGKRKNYYTHPDEAAILMDYVVTEDV